MKYFLSIAILTFSLSLWSHEGGHHEKVQTWKIGNEVISGDFLLLKNEIVYLQTEDGATKKIPLHDFSTQARTIMDLFPVKSSTQALMNRPYSTIYSMFIQPLVSTP